MDRMKEACIDPYFLRDRHIQALVSGGHNTISGLLGTLLQKLDIQETSKR